MFAIGSRVCNCAVPLCRNSLRVGARSFSNSPPPKLPFVYRALSYLTQKSIKYLKSISPAPIAVHPIPVSLSSDLQAPTNQPQFKSALLNSIMGNTELKKAMKQDFAVPVKLANNEVKFKRVGGEKAFEEAYNAMAFRLEKSANAKKGDRQNNPLPATVATTGGGKSFFLDELGALRSEDLEKFCSNPEMRHILLNSVAVPITFNDLTPFTGGLDDIHFSSSGLALRALYSYFIDSGVEKFSAFDSIMRPKQSRGPSLSEAIDCIMEHSNKGVLLLVDEIMKSGGYPDLNTISEPFVNGNVSEIGKCLDTMTTKFNVVITTLNVMAFDKEETYSGRRIAWIPLVPPTLEEATSLFGDSVKGNSEEARNLRRCIADCNGHHRSLEALKIVWDRFYKKYDYTNLIKTLGDTMDRKYRLLTIDLIKPALRGLPVCLDASPDGKQTYAQYLQSGFYLNTYTSKSNMFVPRVSPLQLLLYADVKLHLGSPQEQLCAKALSNLFALEENFTWQQYERFHANWEVLYRVLFSKSKNTFSITEIYQGPFTAVKNMSWSNNDKPKISPCLEAAPTTPEVVPTTTLKAVPATTPKAVATTTPEAVPTTTSEAVPATGPDAVPATTPKAVPATTPEVTDTKTSPMPESVPLSSSLALTYKLSNKSAKLLQWSSHFPQTIPNKPTNPKRSKEEKSKTQELTPEELKALDEEKLMKITLVEHEANLLESVIILTPGNPGFDIVIFEEQVNGKPVVLCVECQHSDPEAKTLLNKAEIESKHELALRQFSPYFLQKATLCGLTLTKEDVYLIVCAFRQTNKNVCQNLPSNTIVLDQQQLEALYSPSLATHPQFLLLENTMKGE